MRYSIQPSMISTTEPSGVVRLDDDVWIPFDPANTDYQQYLAWLAEGNTPEPWNPDTINGGEE